jgi:hypothetical protein
VESLTQAEQLAPGMDNLSAGSRIYIQTTSFLLDQVRLGRLNDQRIVRIYILDKEKDKVLIARNIQLYTGTDPTQATVDLAQEFAQPDDR